MSLLSVYLLFIILPAAILLVVVDFVPDRWGDIFTRSKWRKWGNGRAIFRK